MKITFYAHASFRLEADGVVVITDPYKPPLSRFDPIDEPADLVLMSSATDEFHSDPSHIRGEPVVINTLELPPEGVEVRRLRTKTYRWEDLESATVTTGWYGAILLRERRASTGSSTTTLPYPRGAFRRPDDRTLLEAAAEISRHIGRRPR